MSHRRPDSFLAPLDLSPELLMGAQDCWRPSSFCRLSQMSSQSHPIPRYPRRMTRPAYAGIDVAFAKGKRLPVSICMIVDGRLTPLALRGTDFLRPGPGQRRRTGSQGRWRLRRGDKSLADSA